MDNLFEIIVPILFAAIYFFGNMLSGKSEDESAPGGKPQSAPRRGEDPEAAERRRRIQEEIRRKIQERRSAEGEGGRSRPPQQPDRPARDRQTPVWQDSQEAPPPAARIPPPATGDIYANQMQKRLEQIEATKRRAAKLQKEAQASREKLKPTGSSSPRTSPSALRPRGSVRATLRDPAAARTAFIYGEVLGPPVSQRTSNPVPGLS